MRGVNGVNEVTGVMGEDLLFVGEERAVYNGRPRSHRELKVYVRAFALAEEIFDFSKALPQDERFSLTSQIRRSSRSVCANVAEGWRKRRYRAAFIAKLSDAEAEAAETQTWIEFAQSCGYMDADVGQRLWDEYEALIATIIGFIDHADQWTLK